MKLSFLHAEIRQLKRGTNVITKYRAPKLLEVHDAVLTIQGSMKAAPSLDGDPVQIGTPPGYEADE
jgi:hypothetical protein